MLTALKEILDSVKRLESRFGQIVETQENMAKLLDKLTKQMEDKH